MEENLEYLETKYKECIMKILNNDKLSYVAREFYAESPNWYNNNDFKNVIDTLVWLTYSDNEKKEKLNNELEEYFDL
tara:strand:+ start:95 stop:325 length:231 start_codon:yes stop_codon:yes gene_type:complete